MSYGIIYRLTNTVTGKSYVGQTTQPLAKRWKQHCETALAGSSSILHLANSLRKHGKQVFDCEVLDVAQTQEDLDAKEMQWIASLGTISPKGYNLKSGGGGGGKASAESKERMRIAQLGKKQTQETIEKRAVALRGKKRPDISAQLKEQWKTRSRVVAEDVRIRQSEAHKGKTLSEAQRICMQSSQKIRRQQEKLNGGGPEFSEGAREAMRVAKLGTKQSEETKAKRSASLRAFNARRREVEAV